MLIPIALGLASLAFGYKLMVKEDPKLAFFAPKGHPVPGLPTSGPGSPAGLTPPGVPQPAGQLLSLPPVTNPSDALTTAAAALMQGIQTGSVGASFNPLTQGFQSAFNANAKPTTPLKVDGKYGPKCHAALQSVVAPAIAPMASAAHPVVVPATPAAAPMLGVNPQQAASDLLTFFAAGAQKGSLPQVSTFQAAWNSSGSTPPLVVDGKYGGKAQAALQGLLTWMGSGQPAPQNLYGASKPPYTFSSGGATPAPSLATPPPVNVTPVTPAASGGTTDPAALAAQLAAITGAPPPAGP